MRVASGPLVIWALGVLFLALTYVASGQPLDINQIFVGESYGKTESSGILIFGHIVYNIAYIIASISLYINGYRYAILHEGGDQWMTFNFNMRFVKMFLYALLIAILGGIYVAISAGIIIGAQTLFAHMGLNVILGVLLFLYGLYLVMRLILYPVLIAIDQSQVIKGSWRLMRGNVLRFLGLALLIMLTFALIGVVGFFIIAILFMISAMGGPILMALSLLLGLLFILFLVFYGWAVNSKMMGLVYQQLSVHSVKE